MMDLQPIYGQPILSADEYLVVGDLHIGVESHLRSKGFHLVSHTDDMIKDLRDAAEMGASKLIVLGDVKDSVPGSNRQEYREIPDFFETLFETFDSIDLVRGNHDTNIEEFVPSRVRLHPATGMKIREVGFVHGHMWPSNDVMACKTLVMAHNHPTVMFKDGVGRRTTEPCWMKGRFKEDAASERYSELPEQFLIVPAFNRMLGGSPINANGEDLLGPILNSELLDLDESRIFLLDGLDLGRRCNIMVDSKDYSRYKDSNRNRAKYS